MVARAYWSNKEAEKYLGRTAKENDLRRAETVALFYPEFFRRGNYKDISKALVFVQHNPELELFSSRVLEEMYEIYKDSKKPKFSILHPFHWWDLSIDHFQVGMSLELLLIGDGGR